VAVKLLPIGSVFAEDSRREASLALCLQHANIVGGGGLWVDGAVTKGGEGEAGSWEGCERQLCLQHAIVVGDGAASGEGGGMAKWQMSLTHASTVGGGAAGGGVAAVLASNVGGGHDNGSCFLSPMLCRHLLHPCPPSHPNYPSTPFPRPPRVPPPPPPPPQVRVVGVHLVQVEAKPYLALVQETASGGDLGWQVEDCDFHCGEGGTCSLVRGG
jgi:hypothetical protein